MRSSAGAVPREYISAVERGVGEALGAGVLAGYEMVDVKVTLIDGSYHEVDSSEMAFKIAGSMAVKEAAKRARPVLLEPAMKVEVVVPEEFMGAVTGRPALAPRAGGIDRGAAELDASFRPRCRFRRCSVIRRPSGP